MTVWPLYQDVSGIEMLQLRGSQVAHHDNACWQSFNKNRDRLELCTRTCRYAVGVSRTPYARHFSTTSTVKKNATRTFIERTVLCCLNTDPTGGVKNTATMLTAAMPVQRACKHGTTWLSQ